MRYAWHRRGDYLRSGRGLRAPLNFVLDRLLDRIRRWDRRTADRVTQFVAISQTVAARIAECYGRTSRVIYPPVDTHFYTPADVPREDFYLCVSALVPYKRLELAIEACQRLRRRLVVIGDGPQRGRLARLAAGSAAAGSDKMGTGSRPITESYGSPAHARVPVPVLSEPVSLLGWQSDEVIRDHLRRARALLFPGNEDFGIVPLEAHACGTPVLAFAQGGATETVLPATSQRRGTGLWVEQQTADCFAQAIQQFEAHSDWFDAALARRRAEEFAAERFERELCDLVEETAAGRDLPTRSPS
jgi:glycosyltransferase involved in cell wall biosynthesis